MIEILWKVKDFEFEFICLGKKSSLFVHSSFGKELMFIHEADVTFLMLFSNLENQISLEYIWTLRANCVIRKITGNDNCFLMLGANQFLYYLQLQIDDEAAVALSSSNIHKLSKESALNWCKLHDLENCLDVIGVRDIVLFLHDNEAVQMRIYKSNEVENGFLMMSHKHLYLESNEISHLIKINGRIAKIISKKLLKNFESNEVVLIIEPSHFLFFNVTAHGFVLSQLYATDFDTNTVVQVIVLQQRGFILIVCKSGKIVVMKFLSSGKTFHTTHVWLPQKVFGILGLEDKNQGYLLWSDLNNLYFSRLSDDCVITNIFTHQNIKGVRHFAKINSNILAITRNGFFYEGRIENKEIEIPGTSAMSPDKILSKIYSTGKVIEKFKKESENVEDFINAVKISRDSEIFNKIIIVVQLNLGILKNRCEHTLQKNVWKLQCEAENFMKREVEIKKLDSDILPGGDLTFYWNKINSKSLKISLICEVVGSVVCINLTVQHDTISRYENNALFKFDQCLTEMFNHDK